MNLLRTKKLTAGQTSAAIIIGTRQAAAVLLGGTAFTATVFITTEDPRRPLEDLTWVPYRTVRAAALVDIPMGATAARVRCTHGTCTAQAGGYDVTHQHISYGVSQTPASGVTPDEFDALDVRVTTLEGQVVGLDGRLTAAEGALGGLRDDVQMLDGSVHALVDLGADHEARLAVLEAYSPVRALLDLVDVPDAYAGAPEYLLRVRADLSGIEFVPPGTAGGDGGTVPAGIGSLTRVSTGTTNLKSDPGSAIDPNPAVLRDGIYPGTPPRLSSLNPQPDGQWAGLNIKLAEGVAPQLTLSFAGARTVSSVRVTFGVNEVVESSGTLRGAYAPTHVRAGVYVNGAWQWGPTAQPGFTQNMVGTVELSLPADTESTQVGVECWTTKPGASTAMNARFMVGEFDVYGPGPVVVGGLKPDYRLLLASGTEVRGTNSVRLLSTQRVSVLDTTGLEKASTVMSPGDTWTYAET